MLALQHFVTLPTFSTIVLSAKCIDQIIFPLNMDISSNYYSLKAVVYCRSHHFTIAIMGSINWLYFDDLRTSVTRYHSFHDMLNSHPSGCFFFLAVCEKSPFPVNKILNTDIQTSERKDSPPRHSILSNQDSTVRTLANYETGEEHKYKSINTNERDQTKEIRKFCSRKQYMKEYKQRKKSTIDETEKRVLKEKRNIYMKEYRKKGKCSIDEAEQCALKCIRGIFSSELIVMAISMFTNVVCDLYCIDCAKTSHIF